MRTIRILLFSIGVFAASAGAAVAEAQLRPLDPLPAGAFDPVREPVSAEGGFGVFAGQRASLAGAEGTLVEIGNFRGFWRTGRVTLEVGGTALRVFEDEASFTEPDGSVDPESGPRRRDSGDYRVGTSVRLTPRSWPAVGYLRFGTRLPTTDNTVGLDRDRTDFFATVGAHAHPGRWSLGAESGIGIFGTRHHRLEQSDVVVYAGSAEYDAGGLSPRLMILGHFDGMPGGAIRGTEELAEIRVGARAGGRLWISVEGVRGLTDFSPSAGLLMSAGYRFR